MESASQAARRNASEKTQNFCGVDRSFQLDFLFFPFYFGLFFDFCLFVSFCFCKGWWIQQFCWLKFHQGTCPMFSYGSKSRKVCSHSFSGLCISNSWHPLNSQFHFNAKFPVLLMFLVTLKIVLINMVTILMMSVKLATLDILK